MVSALLRKLLAVSLSTALVLASVPAAAFAEAFKPSLDEALKYLKAQGVYKDDNDPVKSYLFNGDQLSPMGQVLFDYLKAQPNAQEEVQGFKEALDGLRKSGEVTQKKRRNMDKALADYQAKFGSLGAGAGGEDTFRLGTLREAIMTGAAVGDPPKQDYTQVEIADGWEFWDKDGLAFRLNKNQVTTYNRDLQKSQRTMNETRPPQAPFVPETGRYNYQMLEFSYWRLADQLGELDKAYHIDRMIKMAELLGKQYKDDMWFTDAKLEPDLEEEARNKHYSHRGRDYTLYEIVQGHMTSRVAFLEESRKGLANFMAEIQKMKGADSISDAQIGSMQLHEQYVMRYLSLVFLETQRFHVKDQLERLDPASPDSELLKKAIEDAPMDEATRKAYFGQRDALKARTQHIMDILAKVQDVLYKSDYAASLDLVQAALNSAQKEMGEVGLDYSLFAEMPSAGYLAKTNLGGLSPEGWAIKAFWKSRIYGAHSERMDEVKRMLPEYQKAAEAISRGDFKEARRIVLAMQPDAIIYHRDIAPKAAAGRITDSLRVTASMAESREILTKVAGTNLYVGKVGNFLTIAAALALAAPIGSTVLRGTAKLAGLGSGIPVLNIPLKIIAEAAEHTAARLESLSPAAQNISAKNAALAYAKASGVRFVNAAARQASFTALSGGISGVWTAASNVMQDYLPKANLGIVKTGDGHSIYSNPVDAFEEGFKGGVVWANDSWHPMLGYVGLPSTVFEGTPLARAAQTLGERGVVGSLGKLAQSVGVPISEKLSLNALAESGVWGKIAAFPLGMADNVAKYAIVSDLAGKAAQEISWRRNYDVEDVERRIKISEAEGQKWLASPVWLALPVYPAKYEAAASDFQRSLQGQKEYTESGRRAEMANAAENQELPLLSKPEIPIMQQIFNLRWKGEPQEGATFRVNKEMRRQAIADELLEAVPGGGKGKLAADINPLEFFSVTKMSDKDMVGKLHVNDDVRLAARQKFDEAIVSNKTLTEKILNAKAGEEVAGFGRVTPELRREVSHTVLNSEAAAKAKEVLNLPLVEKNAAAKRIEARAGEVLKPYLESDNLPKPAAKEALEAVRKVGEKVSDSKAIDELIFTADAWKQGHDDPESPFYKKTFSDAVSKLDKVTKFDKDVVEMITTVQEWKEGQGNPKSPYGSKSYQQLLVDLKAQASKKYPAGSPQLKVFEGLYKYMDSIEARFNSFNKVGVAEGLCKEILGGARLEHAQSKNALKVVERLDQRLSDWRASQASADGGAIAPGNRAFLEMIADSNRILREAKAKKEISPAEFEALRASVKEMEASPWVLHDSKGSALPSWRPEQFEGLMTSLGLIALQGKGGEPIRQFVMLKTGGGKTMMTFEGLLPLAEADAAYHSQVTRGNFGKMEVMFLTVQSNLEAQARLEFMAFKKLGSSLKFETYEGLKTKIADGKLYYKDVAKKTWILGDEMDGAALQPMLTIGEVTARVMKAGGVYHLLEKINDHLETELARADVDLGEAVKAEARRAQAAVDKIDALSPEGAAARRVTEKMLKAAEELSGAKTPEEREAISQTLKNLVAEQSRIVDSAPLSQSPKAMAELAKSVETLSGLGEKLEKAKTPASAAKTKAQIEGVLKDQQRIIDKANLAETVQGRAVKAQAESLRARLARAEEPSQLVKETVSAQQQVLDSANRVDARQALEVRQAGERVLQRIAERKELGAKEKGRLLADAQTAARQQENLLELIKDDAPTRIKTLRQKAQGLREQAERKFAALLKKNPGSPELARLQEQIDLARAFETEAPEFAERYKEAREARADAQGRLDGLELAGDKLLSQLQAARRQGAPTEGLEAELKALTREKGEVVKEVLAAERRMEPSAAELSHARDLFAKSNQAILKAIEEGKPGWEGAARDMLAARQELLESFAYSENPIYKVYRRMKDDMYPVARSEYRMQDDAQILRDLSREVKKIVHGTITDLIEVSRDGKDAKLDAALKEEVSAREPSAGTFDEMRSYVDGAQKRTAAFKEILEAMPKSEKTAAALKGLAERETALVKAQGELKMSADEAARLWSRRIDGEPSLTGLAASFLKTKLFGREVDLGDGRKARVRDMAVDDVGLSRIRAVQLLKAVLKDPVMSSGQRSELFWTILPSALWPRGVTGKGNSWVRTEMINMGRGYFENPATIRMDNITGNINVIHNGQWFESMDNPGRRWWELEYGTDLTLPYKHKTVSTIKDITENKKTRFISLSGTAGNEFRSHLRENEVKVGGTGSTAPSNVKLDLRSGAAEKFASVKEALLAARANNEGRVVAFPQDKALPKAAAAWFETQGLAKKDVAVVSVSDAPKGEVRDFLAGLKKSQNTSGLVVLSLSDTRILKAIRKYLVRSGLVGEGEIAQVFSDSEYLRLNRPQARVGEQMNLPGLNDGRVKVLMLDTRVGGRGLDLNFKGDRENPDPGAFKGYTNFEMAILDPQEMSSVHLLQSEGRIDLGRVLPGASRNFSLVMDVKSVEAEPMFRQMFNEDEFFVRLREDPSVLEFAKKAGRAVDWALIHDYVTAVENRIEKAQKPGKPELAAQEVVDRYYDVVGDWLEKRQSEVEKDQLRQSSVLEDRPYFDPKFRGLELAR